MLNNIEAERARFQLTKDVLAHMVGISQTTYVKYVKGSPMPTDVLLRFADIFGCSTDYLLGLTDNRN